MKTLRTEIFALPSGTLCQFDVTPKPYENGKFMGFDVYVILDNSWDELGGTNMVTLLPDALAKTRDAYLGAQKYHDGAKEKAVQAATYFELSKVAKGVTFYNRRHLAASPDLLAAFKE